MPPRRPRPLRLMWDGLDGHQPKPVSQYIFPTKSPRFRPSVAPDPRRALPSILTAAGRWPLSNPSIHVGLHVTAPAHKLRLQVAVPSVHFVHHHQHTPHTQNLPYKSKTAICPVIVCQEQTSFALWASVISYTSIRPVRID